MMEMSITFFFAIQNFEKETKSLEKRIFRQKKDYFFELSDKKVPKRDQMPFKGPTCHHWDILACVQSSSKICKT